jgi:hypothetical protein
MAQRPQPLTLQSGDLLLGNWVSVLGRLANKSGQRWGHVGLIVHVDHAGPNVYDISLTSQKPVVTPLAEYLANPALTELAVRQLAKPLSEAEDVQFRHQLVSHDKTRYPAIGDVLRRLSQPPERPTSDPREVASRLVRDSRELTCAELVRSVLWNVQWLTRGHTGKDYARAPTILPDDFAPGRLRELDSRYEPFLKLIARRDVSANDAYLLLRPQLEPFAQYLSA